MKYVSDFDQLSKTFACMLRNIKGCYIDFF